MKNNSRIFVWITFIFMVVIVFYTNSHIQNEPDVVNKYDELMLYDFENSYPSSPYDVIEANNNILKYLYSSEISDDEIEPLIKLQRKLFAETFIELNPENVEIENMKEEIKTNQENKVSISDIKTNSTEYDDNTNKVCIIKVLYYMSTSVNTYRTYTLIKEYNTSWKIYGWEDSTKDFISMEELTQ